MKQFLIQSLASRNRKTTSDLKLKKSTNIKTEDLFKINNSFKIKPPKLSPIIGQITIIPIKPQYALVKEMLLGNQVIKLKGAHNTNFKFKTQQAQQRPKQNQLLFGRKYQHNQSVKNQQSVERNKFNTTQSVQNNIETDKFQIKSQKMLQQDRKARNKLNSLPKIQSQSKYFTERSEKPILSSIDQNLRSITALHFFIQQHKQKTPIIAHRSKTKIEVASLTKIMTFYTVYKICLQYTVNMSQTQITIQEKMTQISGTSAGLESSQIYTIQQLLYGMMLPSGNDAALALAIWGGRMLTSNIAESQNQIKTFINRMNFQAKQLQMANSSFGNCHGLPHRNNRTTCQDIAKLCSECLQITLFKQIVSTRLFKFRIYDPLLKRKIALQWQNTNKLLRRPGFIGIKTGITVTAGPCLASAYQFMGKIYIAIVAKCSKPSRRFKQTRKLLAHCLQRIEHQKPLQKQQKLILKRLSKKNDDIDSDYSEEEVKFNFQSFTQEEIQKRAKTLTQI